MRQPDTKRSQVTGEGVCIELRVPEHLDFTEGHFPDHPIVPGVVLLDWARDLAVQHLSCPPELSEVLRTKFKYPLQPGDDCTLELTWNDKKNRLSFAYTKGDNTVAKGRLIMVSA